MKVEIYFLWFSVGAVFVQPKRCSNSDLYFNLYPKGVTVREGSSAFLECNVSDSCNVQFHWTMDDVPLTNISRRYQNGSNLVISKVNKSLDSGEFKCVATITSKGLSIESLGATLSIQWISEDVRVEWERQRVGDKNTVDEVVLYCNATGTEELLASAWYLNDRRITKAQAAKYSIDEEKRTLIIKNPGPSENGVYSCEAENSAGAVRSRKNFLLSITYEGLPKLIMHPQDVLVRSGADVIFQCSFDVPSNISWRKTNGELIKSSSYGKYTHLTNGSLLIRNVTLNDVGTYECRSFGKNGSFHGYSATLKLAYLEDFSLKNFIPSIADHFIRRHQQLEIGCVPPKGIPSPQAYWAKDGEKIISSQRISLSEDLRLMISSVEPTDQGQYKCVAENLAGSKFGSVKIHVTSPPVITHHPASLEVNEGDFVQFHCKFSGDPYPITSVHWKKTGKLLKSADLDKRTKIHPQNGTLSIEHVTPADDGHYDCVVQTKGQEPVFSKQATLKVKLKLKFAPRPVDKKLMFGCNAQIPCVAVGHFPPTIRWFKRTDTLSSPTGINLRNSFPPNVREKNGILYFNSVKFEDAGRYTCTASSSQGYINETIRVDVYIFPAIVQGPLNATLLVGSEIYFHCIVKGQPKPKVEWYFEERAESEQWPFLYTKFDNNSIVVKNLTLKHAGRYTCIAGNKAGFKRQEAVLCVRAPRDHFAHCGPQVGLLVSRHDFQLTSSVSRTNWNEASPVPDSLNKRSRSSTFNDDDIIGAGGQNASSTAIVAAAVVGVYFVAVIALAAGCGLRLRRRRRPKSAGANRNVDGHGESRNGLAEASADIVTYQRRTAANNNKRNNGTIVELGNGEDRVLLGSEVGRNQDALTDSNRLDVGNEDVQLLNQNCSAPYSSYVHAVQHDPSCIDDDDLATTDTLSATLVSSIVSDTVRVKFECARANLCIGSLLGTGQFGEVRLAKIIGQRARTDSAVFVKLCTSLTDELTIYELNRELEMYSSLQHANIAKFIGICCAAKPLLVIYEYLEYGNMKHYLMASQSFRSAYTGTSAYPPPLAPNQITSIAHQISKAMEYLTGRGFLHRDLAARNVLLSPDFTAKICHLSLNKDAFSSEYCMYRNRNIPLRWMPREAILNENFSEKSDVFSYSVFLWELYTNGQMPYQSLNDWQLLESILKGESILPTIPHHVVPQQLANLMHNCWRENAEERPTFLEILQLFNRWASECDV